MNALHKSIDETLAAIRTQHVEDLKSRDDRILALEIENRMLRDSFARAQNEAGQWMRVTTKLMTQFSLVEKVFADAKAMAVAHAKEEASLALRHREEQEQVEANIQQTTLPQNDIGGHK